MAFKSVYDKNFKYRNSCATDIRQTFDRVRREMRLQKERAQGPTGPYGTKVVAAIGGAWRPAEVE